MLLADATDLAPLPSFSRSGDLRAALLPPKSRSRSVGPVIHGLLVINELSSLKWLLLVELAPCVPAVNTVPRPLCFDTCVNAPAVDRASAITLWFG